MKLIRIIKSHALSILSVCLTLAAFLSESDSLGVHRAAGRILPLSGMSLTVLVINGILIRIGISDRISRSSSRKSEKDSMIRIVIGTILWAAAVPVLLVVTQKIIRYRWGLLPAYYGPNLALLALVLILVTLLAGNFRVSVFVCSLILTLIALVSFYVNQFRGKPLTVFDVLGIRTAADVASGYVVRLNADVGMCLQSLLLFLTLQIRLQSLSLPNSWAARGIRAGSVCACAAMLVLFCDRVLWTEKWMQAGDDYTLNTTYAEKGFYPKFISEIGYLHIEKPDEYSAGKVKEIVGRLEEEKQEKGGEGTVTPQNIIVIMNESFADPEMLGEVKTDREILPNLHALESGGGTYVRKGILHVPVFGGGTANTEYEVLTGNSMQFLTPNVVSYEAYCHNPEYGLAMTLKEQGYTTVAIHPGWDNAWNRKQVFPMMGFERIIFKKDWEEDYDTLRGKVTDEEAYRKIEKVFEQKSTDEKMFLFCVTIQNHGGYSAETAEGYEPDIHLNYDREYPETELYFSLLRESDRAFADLLTYFKGVSEPTMIVFFGDHQVAPDEDRFYEEVLSGELSRKEITGTIEAAQMRYIIPLVIWTNYETDSMTEGVTDATDMEISSNYLGSCILTMAGLRMAPFNRLLLNLKEMFPVIGPGADMLRDGTWKAAEKTGMGEQTADLLLSDYRMMQYNNTIDWRNKVAGGFAVSPERAKEP